MKNSKTNKNLSIKELISTFIAFITLALVVEVAILVTTKLVGWQPSIMGRPWVVSAHVHIMVLGAFFTLIMMLLDKSYSITKTKLFKPFFITYLVGFSLLLAFILYKGFVQLLDATIINGLLQAGAGLAHITMFVSLFMFCAVLKDACKEKPLLNKEQPYVLSSNNDQSNTK
ncbi:MAG: DUF2871 family protein [Clostridia bacterium]